MSNPMSCAQAFPWKLEPEVANDLLKALDTLADIIPQGADLQPMSMPFFILKTLQPFLTRIVDDGCRQV